MEQYFNIKNENEKDPKKSKANENSLRAKISRCNLQYQIEDRDSNLEKLLEFMGAEQIKRFL